MDEVGVEGRAAVALVPLEGRARNVVDDAVGVDTAHVAVPRVRDNERAFSVNRNVVRIAEIGLGCGAAVPAVGARSVPRDGADDARRRIDGAYSLAPNVRDVDMPVRADAEAVGAAKVGIRGNFPVVNRRATEDGRDDTRLTVDSPRTSTAVGVEHGPVGIGPNSDFDGVDLGLGGLDALFAHAGDAGAGDGRDDAGLRVHAADAEAVLLADV